MPFTQLTNLRQDLAYPCSPWEWTTPVPEAARLSKAALDKWRMAPNVSHQFYSPWEPVNPHARLVKPTPGYEGNPPALLHGLVMDVDQMHTNKAVDEAMSRLPAGIRPQWHGTSASGNVHLIWIFERPIPIPNFEFAEHLLCTFAKRWKLDQTLGGFDEGAFTDPSRYLTNGGVWRRLAAKEFVDPQELNSVEYQAASSFTWATQREWPVLPLEKVQEQLLKDPRFVQGWNDIEFVPMARGPSWFVDGATSTTSCVILPSGAYTFSAHATKRFHPWSDLLGRGFVEGSTATAVADAASGVYFDGKLYYRKLAKGEWKGFGKEDITSFLKIAKRIPDKAPKGGVSELSRALQFIQEHHFVDGVAPVVFREAGLVEINGRTILNNCTKRAIRPAPTGNPEWGHDFPYIASIVDALFPHTYVGRKYFISWLAVFYKMCLANKLSSGQNAVIAGGVGMGKTLLARAIVGRLVAGSAEAADFLMGKDNFGGELFESALWVLDDAAVAADRSTHRVFSEALKKMAANRSHKVNVKYAMPAMTQWQGRIMVSCNDDAHSVQMLPSLDHSIVDKLMLFRVPPDSVKPAFLPFDKGEVTIERELPFFARWLSKWETPEECVDLDPRFGGVKAFADPFLVKTANQSSYTAPLADVLTIYFRDYKVTNPSENFWEGSVAELYIALNADNGRKELMRSYPITSLANQLAQLAQRGFPIEVEDGAGESRHWRYDLNAKTPAKAAKAFRKPSEDDLIVSASPATEA